MRFPRVILGGLLVAAGIALPAMGARLDSPAPDVIGMSHDGFVVNGVVEDDDKAGSVPVITIHAGETLTFQNNSRWIHIVAPGQNGTLAPPGMGAMTPRKMMQQNDSYTTPGWEIPGTYLITCTVHPDMNAKVVVLP